MIRLSLICVPIPFLLMSALATYPPIPNTTWKINLGQTAPLPLLQKPIQIVQVGDAEVSRPGVWGYTDAVLTSAVCKKFSCTSMEPPKGKTGYKLYAIEDRMHMDDYRFQAGLEVFTDGKGHMSWINLGLPPRPETGLTGWDLSLVDSVFRNFTGKAPDVTALKACYKVRIKDLREPCPVQRWTVNTVKYRTAAEFIYLETVPGRPDLTNPKPDLRSFSLGIIRDQ